MADLVALYSHFGSNTWLYDINSDGTVNSADVMSLVTQVFRTAMGDFNLDGVVDGSDYSLWKNHFGTGLYYSDGDANLDGHVDAADYTIWRDHLGFHTSPLGAGSGAGAVPEAPSISLAICGLACLIGFRGWKTK